LDNIIVYYITRKKLGKIRALYKKTVAEYKIGSYFGVIINTVKNIIMSNQLDISKLLLIKIDYKYPRAFTPR